MMKNFFLPLVPILLPMLFLGCSTDSNDDGPIRPTAVDTTANLQGTGDSANDLLSNATFSKLRVEIAYVKGFRPTQAAMEEFVNYLKHRTFKEDIELVYNELASPNEEELTLDEIADLEKKNRTAYNDGETLAVYIYFSDAPAEGDEEEEGLVTLGAVYRNTSMIIHEATVRRLADQSIFISDADVESSTLNHEFGHLFGLVNLGTDPVNDHEDVQTDGSGEPVLDDNGNTMGNSHCDIDGCLMKAELQFGGASNKGALQTAKSNDGLKAGCRLSGKSVLQMLSARTAKGQSLAPGLDSECILDLQSNGGR
jgi:hypothetical protein